MPVYWLDTVTQVRLFVCLSDYLKTYERIYMKYFGGLWRRPTSNWLDFDGDRPHDPDAVWVLESRSGSYAHSCCIESVVFTRWQHNCQRLLCCPGVLLDDFPWTTLPRMICASTVSPGDICYNEVCPEVQILCGRMCNSTALFSGGSKGEGPDVRSPLPHLPTLCVSEHFACSGEPLFNLASCFSGKELQFLPPDVVF